jgi:hypothetical protein
MLEWKIAALGMRMVVLGGNSRINLQSHRIRCPPFL